MGDILRFPDQAAEAEFERGRRERLEAQIRADHERERRTVAEAFAAVERGDFDDEAVHEVIRGRAGDWEEYVDLCDLMALVARVVRACDREGTWRERRH